MSKKLRRSVINRKSYGVIGGIADYFNIDPYRLRSLFLAIVILTANFILVLIYIGAIFVIPSEDEL